MANLVIQPVFMGLRYRKLPKEMKKTMIPAIILVPGFNLLLTNYFGKRMDRMYTDYANKYVAHLKDYEILEFDDLYAKLKFQ